MNTEQPDIPPVSVEVALSEHFLENGILVVNSAMRPLLAFLRDMESLSLVLLGSHSLEGTYRKGGGYVLSLELSSLCRRLQLRPGQSLRLSRSLRGMQILDVVLPCDSAAVLTELQATIIGRELPSLKLKLSREEFDRAAFLALSQPMALTGQKLPTTQFQKFAARLQESCQTEADLFQVAKRPGLDYYPHQVEAARRVIFRCQGRALLADEVGLGKTVEAGLVLLEYLRRSEVQRILIVTPASLTRQWQMELAAKFELDFKILGDCSEVDQFPMAIVSLDTGKSRRNLAHFLSLSFDMVIVDEAHKLKNRKTLNYQFVRKLPAKYLLLLTATPIQNDLEELFNLVHLLSPGTLGTLSGFRRRFMNPMNRRAPKDPEQLQSILRDLMVRNTRRSTSLNLPPRQVVLRELDFHPAEKRLYDSLEDFIYRTYFLVDSERGGLNQLTLMLWQKLVTSSPVALIRSLSATLQKMDGHNERREELQTILDYAKDAVVCTKLQHVQELLQLELKGERVLIFTQFRATQDMLAQTLSQSGLSVYCFHGEMSASEKQQAIENFRRHTSILVSTDAGSEGQNLQFVKVMINFDLPWNPMKVEQRIGRIHRLGQSHEVLIINLCIRETIESHIVNLLERKIRLFERIVGELEMILGYMDEQLQELDSLEPRIMEIVARYRGYREQAAQIELLGQQFAQAASQYQATIQAQDDVFLEGSGT